MYNVLTPAEKYERQKELSRLRQKRFYEKNSETIKQKKKSDRMELKQLRTQMANTQINPPIVPAPASKRTDLDDLAQYASDDEYEEPTHSGVRRARRGFFARKRARIRRRIRV